jgi:heme/copper-type cytochrome/quinol oxidase subunit 3
MNHQNHHESVFRTWIWLGIMLAIILFKGFLAFYVVSDMGQPTWAYRPVKDVPAASPYAVYHRLPNPQHIRGAGGE